MFFPAARHACADLHTEELVQKNNFGGSLLNRSEKYCTVFAGTSAGKAMCRLQKIVLMKGSQIEP